MKVLFTIDSLQQGGAEQSIANIIQHFSKDVEVTVLYFYPKADLLPTYKILNCKIISMNLTGKYEWIKAIKGLKKIIKEKQPDVVVTSLYRSNIISRIACFLTNTKLVGTFVDDSYNAERRITFKGIGLLKYQATWFLDRITSFIPTAWISNSKCIGENNAKKLGLSLSKIKVVYRGRNSAEFTRWNHLLTTPFNFVTIGRLYEKKGYPELIEAFSQLCKKYPYVKLTIYGEGSYRSKIEESIQEQQLNDRIILAGNVPAAWLRLYDSNCFVFPSRFEGFSGALVEAMMTGIPIISSDIPMNLEAVEHHHTALVHEMKNPKDLLAKMEEMINNYPAMIEMGKRAREHAFKTFDIKQIARQYESHLFKIAFEK